MRRNLGVLVMKPALDPKTLRVAVLIVGGTLAALGSALKSGASLSDPATWVLVLQEIFSPAVLMQLGGTLLVGKEVLKRSTDYAPHEVEVVDGRQSVSPPQ